MSAQPQQQPVDDTLAQLDALTRLFAKLASRRYFGRVVVSIQAGKIGSVEFQEVKKLNEL